ncbi:hypothetical protein ACJRPK_12920 [Aquimarina sp. 2-A2]|uniref:hypothetical protein n=1 Tax=Aquimarina sp. 2-A2 TaxID=3382644 RepID=UPI00387F2BD3
MTKIAILLFLIILSCKENKTNLYYSTEKNKLKKIPIELPELNDWKELYSHKLVKRRFNENSNDGTTILGVYLTNEIAKQKESIDDIDFNNYLLFFIRNDEQKWKVQNTDLKRIFDIQVNQASVETINATEALNKAYSDTTFITTEKPYLLNNYSNHEKSYSAIKLIKPHPDDHDYIVVYVYNLINIKNHLVYGGYYLDFIGIESIEKAKENNDIIVSEFIKKNE